MLLIDAIGGSGSGATIKVLINSIKSKAITVNRATTLFMLSNSNFMAPALIADLFVSL